MFSDEVVRVLGRPATVDVVDGTTPPLRTFKYPALGLQVVVHGSNAPRVARILVTNAAYSTKRGIRVGSSSFDVARAYGIPPTDIPMFMGYRGVGSNIANGVVSSIQVD